MSESRWYPLGQVRPQRFNVRVVPAEGPDSTLYHGMRRDWSRERASYERGVIVEVYDARYVKGFTPSGQFVTAYGADTLLSSGLEGRRLVLDGGIPAWTLDYEETRDLLRIAREAVEREGLQVG